MPRKVCAPVVRNGFSPCSKSAEWSLVKATPDQPVCLLKRVKHSVKQKAAVHHALLDGSKSPKCIPSAFVTRYTWKWSLLGAKAPELSCAQTSQLCIGQSNLTLEYLQVVILSENIFLYLSTVKEYIHSESPSPDTHLCWDFDRHWDTFLIWDLIWQTLSIYTELAVKGDDTLIIFSKTVNSDPKP